MSAFSPDETAACRHLVELALAEDLGPTGDRTSLATIPEGKNAAAAFVARSPGVLAGLPAAAMVCRMVDPALGFAVQVNDGSCLEHRKTIATVSG
jgi:nicotinate-nucleotide pyrophosphorylase (carboxylating)